MSYYSNPVALHRSPGSSNFDRSELEGVDFGEGEKSVLEMDTMSDDSSQDRVNVFIVFVFILEFLVLIFVSVLEFFLRETDVFPVREVNFSCSDATINYKIDGGEKTYTDFAYNSYVTFEVICPLAFCVPPFIIVVAEIAYWAFTDEQQKTVRIMCRQCKMPQIIRRIIRFIGAFLFGMLITMIFTDVTKIMVGRLRPTFLEICSPNASLCGNAGSLVSSEVCTENDKDKIRDARLSFPSLHTSMTTFAAGYLAIYLHNVIRAHGVRIMKPFICLSFIMLAVLCGLSRYGLHYSHWEDVLAGFLIGIVSAIYVGVFSLNSFRENLTSHKLYLRLRNFLAEQRALELRDLYKESSQGPPIPRRDYDRLDRFNYYGIPAYNNALIDSYNYSGAMTVPRPQVSSRSINVNGPASHESTTDPVEMREYRDQDRDILHRHPVQRQKSDRVQDTFQRDLTRTLDQYRTTSDDHNYRSHHPGYGHI